MRNEQEMISLILDFARENDRIRAVYLNGSRVNPNVKPDIFQDYDIVYVVTDTKPFISDKTWLSRFGEICVMQEPDATSLPYGKSNPEERYAYLMQFEDGNRIDLTIQSVAVAREAYLSDSLTRPLLDKDGLLPEIPAPSDADYRIRKPTLGEYLSCCNEFWWVSPYVAKGLWRGEILFALWHLEACIRPMLQRMLTWEAGIRHDFSVSAGKCGKYLGHYLPADKWNRFLTTYPVADTDAVWQALSDAADLLGETARTVGEAFGYAYNTDEETRTRAFLRDVRVLPRDASGIR